MSVAVPSGAEKDLELAHVLFVDIVGYSKKLINEQTVLVARLNELVLQTEQCRKADAAGKLIRIPTGDGMALAFFTSPRETRGVRAYYRHKAMDAARLASRTGAVPKPRRWRRRLATS